MTASQKDPILISAFILIAFLIFINFAIKPFLSYRDAYKHIETYLTNVQKGNLTNIYILWDNKNNSPPIYNMTSYKIKNKTFYKKDGVKWASFKVDIYLAGGNILPSGKEWTFDLSYTKVGWKIMAGYMNE